MRVRVWSDVGWRFWTRFLEPYTRGGGTYIHDRVPRCVRSGGDAELIHVFRMLVAWYVEITLRGTVFSVEWFRESTGLGVRAVGNVRYEAMRMVLPDFLERVPHHVFFPLEGGGHASIFRTGGEYLILFGRCIL